MRIMTKDDEERLHRLWVELERTPWHKGKLIRQYHRELKKYNYPLGFFERWPEIYTVGVPIIAVSAMLIAILSRL